MNKHYLMSRFKSTGVAYLLWLFLAAHYAYLGMWGIQILLWALLFFGWILVFLGGIGIFILIPVYIWFFVDLFLIPGKVERYNARISFQIAQIEKKEKEEELQRNMMFASQIGKSQNDINNQNE